MLDDVRNDEHKAQYWVGDGVLTFIATAQNQKTRSLIISFFKVLNFSFLIPSNIVLMFGYGNTTTDHPDHILTLSRCGTFFGPTLVAGQWIEIDCGFSKGIYGR